MISAAENDEPERQRHTRALPLLYTQVVNVICRFQSHWHCQFNRIAPFNAGFAQGLLPGQGRGRTSDALQPRQGARGGGGGRLRPAPGACWGWAHEASWGPPAALVPGEPGGTHLAIEGVRE